MKYNKQDPDGIYCDIYMSEEDCKIQKCYMCKRYKSYSEFYKSKSNPRGLTYRCKQCSDTLTYNWAKNNPEKVNARNMKRVTAKMKATPKWLTKEQKDLISTFYDTAKLCEAVTGEKHQVDHIVPLKSNLVCGFHVPWNLQVLTAKENNKKQNKILEYV